jgi:restriction system protein
MDITFHYPPELMNLLISVIPLLNRSKKDVFLFFKGAGVSDTLVSFPHQQWKRSPEEITKYEIVRQVLSKLNEKGESCLRERREVLKRVVEFENYSVCWDADRLKAKGLVAEIREVVNVKDSFTRINLERDRERQDRLQKDHAQKELLQQRQKNIERVKQDLNQLFTIHNPHIRGKKLEQVLNDLFKVFGIGMREAFVLTGDSGDGILEQLDGVIELEGHLYFVEIKWWQIPIGVPEVSQHLVRVYHRAESRAIIISASDFTAPAITTCKDALQQKVVVLCTLQEIVMLFERQEDLKEFIKRKVHAAIIDKNPYLLIR